MIFKRYVRLFIEGIFLVTFNLVCSATQTVEAQNQQSIGGIDDGIENWTQADRSQVGYLDIGGGKKLGYTFGLARDHYGRVTNGGDSTITKDSYNPKPDEYGAGDDGVDYNNMFRSKINVFLNDNNIAIGSTYQDNYSDSDVRDTLAQDSVSRTSPDFLIAPPNSRSRINTLDFSLLSQMTNKKYYVGFDSNNNKTFKIVGDFVRKPFYRQDRHKIWNKINNGNYNLTAEILLRPSPNNSAVVQRELYLHNSSGDNQELNVLFGEDTMLGTNDGIPIYDLDEKQGLYIQDYQGKYQLMVSNNVPDGFKHYKAQDYNFDGYDSNDDEDYNINYHEDNANNWVKGFDNGDLNGNGDEQYNFRYGQQLIDSTDTSYILSWGHTDLASGQTSHYVSTMGVTASGYAVPYVKKTYTNETSQDGKNHIGDRLKFTLKANNSGMKSSWLYKKLVDKMPSGLQIDPTTIRISDDDRTDKVISMTDYNDDTKTLTVPTNRSLKDGQSATVTFEANITNDAVKNLDNNSSITNKGEFTGIDNSAEDSKSEDKKFTDSSSIPIEASDYEPNFTKQVRNLTTDKNSAYMNKVAAKQDNIVEYKISYNVGYSKNYLLSGAQITDNLPEGVELTNDPVVITTPDGKISQTTTPNTTLAEIKQGETETIEFKAKVTSPIAGQVINMAKLTGANKSNGQMVGDALTNGAEVDTENVDGFVSVPDKIDFGQSNMYGKTKLLKNISTDGELIVRHPAANNFRVNVSYDNDDNRKKIQTATGDTLPTDDTGLIFIKQKSKDNKVGEWKPLLKVGTSIQSEEFSGHQDLVNLTDLVGVNDWQLKVDARAKAGAYNGKLTWTMVDSVQ